MQYWAGLKLNSSIFFLGGGGGEEFKKQKLQNLPHDTLCLSFSCNLILRSDEGLMLETSAFLSFTVANLRFQLSC